MKRIILLAALLVAFSISARAQVQGIVYNTKQAGAKGDCTPAGSIASCTNDVAALRRVVAQANANSGQGGVIYFPDGVYLIQVGDPATDPNYTTIAINGGTSKTIFNLTANNVTIRLSSKAVLRVVATYVYQGVNGSFSQKQHLFFFGAEVPSVVTLDKFRFEGNQGLVTFETAAPASLITGVSNTNQFAFCYGYSKNAYWENLFISGFPTGGLVAGYTGTDGNLYTDSTFYRIKVLQYGSAGHDNWWYCWGKTTFRECLFKTSLMSSHGIYTGADKPGTVIDTCVFDGIDNITPPQGNKYGIQMYAVSGGPITGITIVNSTFNLCTSPILVLKDDAVTYSTNLKIQGNRFIGNYSLGVSYSAILPTRLRNSIITGNTFQDFAQGVKLTNGDGVTVSNNSFDAVLDPIQGLGSASLATVAASNVITNLPASGQGISLAGNGAVIANNVIDIGSNANVIGIACGNDTNPVDYLVIGNTITGAGNATGTKGISATRSYTTLKIINNTVRLTTSGQPFSASGNTADGLLQGNTFVSAGANDVGAVNMNTATSTWKIIGNTFSVPNIYLNHTTSELSDNVITGTLSGTTGVRRAQRNTINGAYEAVTSTSTSYTPDAGLYRVHNWNPATNGTANAPTKASTGDYLTFFMTEPAGGGVGYTFDSTAFKHSCSFSTTANLHNSITFRYDGTAWLQVGACATGY